MKTRTAISAIVFVLLVAMWLTFAYLMRDTPWLGDILQWGLLGALLVAFWLFVLGAD